MNPFEMVVLIILIVTIGRVLSSRYGSPRVSRRDRRQDALGTVMEATPADGVGAIEADRMKNEIKRLNDRLAVLERIAVDPAKRLSDEIDRLKHD